jgi:hypothetical protein
MRRSVVQIRVVITAALLLVLVLAVFVLRQSSMTPTQPGTPAQMMTIDPRIIDNLTQFPVATPLSGQEANELVALREMVDACPAYDDARRLQMVQQIGFIINPSGLSRDAIIALGVNIRAQLLFALGTVTANRWNLDQKPADSCLIPIGKRINELLVAAGEPPIAAFEGD